MVDRLQLVFLNSYFINSGQQLGREESCDMESSSVRRFRTDFLAIQFLWSFLLLKPYACKIFWGSLSVSRGDMFNRLTISLTPHFVGQAQDSSGYQKLDKMLFGSLPKSSLILLGCNMIIISILEGKSDSPYPTFAGSIAQVLKSGSSCSSLEMHYPSFGRSKRIKFSLHGSLGLEFTIVQE